jgi:tocopherol O-methyltransferase
MPSTLNESLSTEIREHYDRLSSLYQVLWGPHLHHGYFEDDESPLLAQIKLVHSLATKAGIPRGGHVLDVGCGMGGSSLWLAQNLKCRVTGITLSPVQAAMARHQARLQRLQERTRFEAMDATALDFPDDSFDAVWIIECSEHIEDKARFIEGCARVLKPGGVFALCSWLRSDHPLHSQNHALLDGIREGMLCPSFGTLDDYLGWMRDAGLEVFVAEDLTPQTAPTWEWAQRVIQRRAVKAILSHTDAATRRFVGAFDLMKQAFSNGTLVYGLFAARKS